jgi:riboflavin synthase
MFTGIIEEIATVLAADSGEITIGAETVMSDLALGQSISIDGVDLTIAALTDRTFHTNVMGETYRRSTLGMMRPGRRVNLERAVLPSTRLSGHIVRGVVEGTAQVEGVSSEADALILRFSTTPELLDYIVVKGPVAVDGASFTIIARDETSFSVSIVSYSQDHTTITDRRVGDLVNLETDILARYVDAAVARMTRGQVRQSE